jgi:hypothetical protein
MDQLHSRVASHFLGYRHKFEWKKEECYLVRKPDPAVLVAITKDPPGRLKTLAIQILDYNLNRHVSSIPCCKI